MTCAGTFNNLWGLKEPTIISVTVPARQATQAGGIDTLESIPGLLKSWKNSGSERGTVQSCCIGIEKPHYKFLSLRT